MDTSWPCCGTPHHATLAHHVRAPLALTRAVCCAGVAVPCSVLVAIMCNCSNLLSVNHKGVRALVPDFVAVLPNLMR